MTAQHEAMLDDVAVYALGALPAADARRVRDHIASCETCAAEYRALAPAAASVGMTAEACADNTQGAVVPSELLKARIMQQVRRDTNDAAKTPARRARPVVWPPYLVAAACFAIALYSSLMNLSLMQQLKSEQSQLAQVQHRSTALAQNLASERATVADLTSEQAQRFNIAQGQIVRVNHRLYLTLHDMPAPERGKVYQAWTLPKGGKLMEPSVTFVPDAHGAAVIALPQNADQTAAVALSVEPQGGSKQPTTKPLVVQSLD